MEMCLPVSGCHRRCRLVHSIIMGHSTVCWLSAFPCRPLVDLLPPLVAGATLSIGFILTERRPLESLPRKDNGDECHLSRFPSGAAQSNKCSQRGHMTVTTQVVLWLSIYCQWRTECESNANQHTWKATTCCITSNLQMCYIFRGEHVRNWHVTLSQFTFFYCKLSLFQCNASENQPSTVFGFNCQCTS